MELQYQLDEIDQAGLTVLQLIGPATVVAFEGEMGAGKTTFIQSICRRLGVKNTMGSPTFSIINEYRSDRGSIFHIDLYRCNSEDEAIRAGVEECLYSGSLCLVEWPSKAPGIFPDDTIRVNILAEAGGKRKIVVH